MEQRMPEYLSKLEDEEVASGGEDSESRRVYLEAEIRKAFNNAELEALIARMKIDHAAEVERLQNVNEQLVKTLDIREAALSDLQDAMRSTDPMQAANCRVLEYHQLKEEVANLKAERENSKSDKSDEIVVWDLDKIMWESIKKAASESNWIPEEYLMNDWVSDVCGWLLDHPEDAKTAEVERLTGERDAAELERDAAVEALRGLLDSMLIHEGEDVMGRVKGTWKFGKQETARAALAKIEEERDV